MPQNELNPYSPPQESLAKTSPARSASELEALARRRIRIAVVVLTPAALANYLLLLLVNNPNAAAFAGPQPGARVALYQTTAAIGLIALFVVPVFFWFRGLWLIERLSGILHGIFGGDTQRAGWIEATWAGSWGLPWGALFGSMVWLAFVTMYVSGEEPLRNWLTFTLLGHICGAIAYLPVIGHWLMYRKQA